LSLSLSVKIKVTPCYTFVGTEGRRRYSSNNIAMSALEGVGVYHHAPAPLSPAKTRYTLWFTVSKGKAIPLQACTGIEGSRRLRLSAFKIIGT
jgi:hypothetical protein